ncbi:hypothetical protein TMEN_8225 [Trichophyton mentagrophytes]|uniref:Uncharacterized protein n=2 Tax=Trichophyton interdigitale TaxID=101480 RepID=A0A9P4YFH9_9EURO|nr:hypothetical protein H101_00815 [Trichophyton interdigitale H6]KAF3893411.1 hypothetical protein GY631_3702 [Trichophyton interdigitale]KDB22997.1 hypothetical protein H109_05104 [Trichophyton interdigitale MR816]GBF65508.1 hypothetical protein TMEN_8225 [Trichophyton mentagrophytes]KAF3895232.1 hypothetical protein GY632_3348 [Trichophyton interdigitale]
MADGVHLKVDSKKDKKTRTYRITCGNNPIPMYTVEINKKSKPHGKVIKNSVPFNGHPPPPPPMQIQQPPPYGFPPPPHFNQSYNQPHPQPYSQTYNQPYNQPYNHPYHPPPQPQNQSYFQSFNNYQPPPGQIVGTITFHELSSKIDVSINGFDTSMKRPDPLASGRKFQTRHMGKLQWKEDGLFSSKQKLVDEKRNVIAKYDKDNEEIIILLPPSQIDQHLDMIVVTGIGIIEAERKSDSDGDAVESIFDVIGG